MSQLLANQVRMMLHVNDGEYRIQQFDAMEGINRPLECQVVFRSDIDCNPNALLGLPVSLRLYSHDAHQRRFDGVVTVARRDATATSDCVWTVTLASKLLQGQQQHRSRLFMQLSRRDVIKKLLIEMGYQVEEIDWRIESSLALSAPLLQAQESNFDCFSRLLSEAGWNYWFEQAENNNSTCFERLVISDQQRWQPLTIGPLWLPPEHGTTAMPDTQRLTMAQRASQMKRAQSVRTQLRPGEHFVPLIGKNQSIWQRGNWETFSAPQSAEAIAQLIQRDEHQHGGAEQRLHLASHQSQLQAGYQVTIVPNRGQTSAIPGEYVVASVRHWGRQPNDQGQPGVVQYHNRAQAVGITQAVQPALVSGPAYLPTMFPARIESRNPHYAELSNDGRYYLRAKFDEPKEQQPDAPAHAAASPAIEVMVPYASPQGEQAQPIGWHFPLLNQSTVLVTCLNNDPNRPLILGFTPNHQMRGPVAHDNAQQSRMVTPAQNELTLDDHKQAPNVVLQTFNGDTRLLLNAHNAQPFIELAVRYGALSMHSAKTLLLAAKEGELKQRIGQTRREQVKHSVHHQTEGHIHWQAAAEQQWQAHGNITQVAEADLSAHTEEGQIRLTVNEQLTVTAQQGMQVHVPKGSMMVQTPSEIRIESEAELLLTSNNGKAGVQVTPNKVTLFGNDVTLKGSQAVSLNGDVHYDKGGNEPVSLKALKVPSVPVNAEQIFYPVDGSIDSKVLNVRVLVTRVLEGGRLPLQITHQAIPEGEPLIIHAEQINPDGRTVSLSPQTCVGEYDERVFRVEWLCSALQTMQDSASSNLPKKPYYCRFRAEYEGSMTDWSERVQINVNAVVRVKTDTQMPLAEGAKVRLLAADGKQHVAIVAEGKAWFTNIASGPASIRLDVE